MYKKNGSLFLVQYLKECHRLTMKSISGKPEECSTFPRVATRRGLPLIIPGYLRVRMERDDYDIIQLVLSVITVYRVFKIPGTLKLNTITDPFKGQTTVLPSYEVKSILDRIKCIKTLKLLPDATLIPSVKAGPNISLALFGCTLDAYAFKQQPELLESLRILSKYTGPALYDLLLEEIRGLPSWLHTITDSKIKESILSNIKLGKLSEKLEAAGKVRVFAITDI